MASTARVQHVHDVHDEGSQLGVSLLSDITKSLRIENADGKFLVQLLECQQLQGLNIVLVCENSRACPTNNGK